jgi:hypothetical protein
MKPLHGKSTLSVIQLVPAWFSISPGSQVQVQKLILSWVHEWRTATVQIGIPFIPVLDSPSFMGFEELRFGEPSVSASSNSQKYDICGNA